jgi:hypothetical protein
MNDINFNETAQYMKGMLAERILVERVLPYYDIHVQFRAPDEQHPFDFIFNIGHKIFAGECKCSSMLEKYDAYAIQYKQYHKYVQLEKNNPNLFILFFVDPFIGSILVAPLKDLIPGAVKMETARGKMIKFNAKDMHKLDYVIPTADCNAMLAYDIDLKTYKYSANSKPEFKGILDKDTGFLMMT